MGKSLQRGVTLIESSVVLVIIGSLLTGSMASFRHLLTGQRFQAMATDIATDLQFMRTEAVARNQNISISFGTGPAGRGCYVIHTESSGATCSCQLDGPPRCTGGAEPIKTVRATDPGIHFEADVRSMVYAAAHGTTSPAGSVSIHDADGHSLKHVVNLMGRLRSCSPAGSAGGYVRCAH